MKQRYVFMLTAAVLFMASGCAIRPHQIQQDRLDQMSAVGSWGPVHSQETRQDTASRENTRTVKVLDLKMPKISWDTEAAQAPSSSVSEPRQRTEPSGYYGQQPAEPSGVRSPVAESPSAAMPGVGAFQEYKVLQNDTLQKIAQKFYGTMHKWPRIYDANRDILKSPNSIKPGQTLKIPAAN
jgi:nucleoid-associated protein YgaU